MKMEINTADKSVTIAAHESAHSIATIDKWIKALRVGREWLRKELENKKS